MSESRYYIKMAVRHLTDQIIIRIDVLVRSVEKGAKSLRTAAPFRDYSSERISGHTPEPHRPAGERERELLPMAIAIDNENQNYVNLQLVADCCIFMSRTYFQFLPEIT